MDLLARFANQPGRRIAVARDGEAVPYGRLREQAGGIAAFLARAGVRPGDRVALALGPGLAGAAAVLGTWAAGCCAVPLDGHLPPARVRAILRRTGARALLGAGVRGAALARAVQWGADAALFEPPPTWTGAVLGEGAPFEPLPVAAGEPASILFTSGSTGDPKGVTVSRDAVQAFVGFWRSEVGLSGEDRVAQCASLAFDLSLFEIGATFSSGASLVPVPGQQLAFPADLGAWTRAQGITVMYAVPSLVLAAASGDQPTLRVLMYAGEAMAARDAVALRRDHPAVRLFNLFGPTETNVACYQELGELSAAEAVPIGEPCPYIDLRVVDEQGRDADEGELVACGRTVMAGYWGEPERARWLDMAGNRYLCTGDRVRRDGRGVLHHLGRIDRMLKIRGYRVEPEEVERRLLAAPAVREAAVVAVGQPAQLVAFVAGDRPDADGLRDQLASELPAQAVPSRIEVVAALPRNERGKVDRAALTDP